MEPALLDTDTLSEVIKGHDLKGQLISDADILLAATALTHGTILVTENAAHFSRIPGLRI